MYRLTPAEVEEIMEGRKTDMIKKMVLLTRPNYYTLFYKQETATLAEVFESLRWELQSTPLHYHYHFYNFIGVYFAVRGFYGKAEEYLLEAIRLKSNSEVTLANFVILMCDCGRREQAAIYFKRLNDIRKNSLAVNLDLGLLFQLFDLNVAARQLFEEVLENSCHVSKCNDFLMYQFGKVLLRHSMGKMYYDNTLDRAIRIFIDINKRDPSFLPNTLSLITALNYKWKQSQKGEGTTTVHPHSEVLGSKISRTKYNNQSHALYILGKIRMKTRRPEEAKECLVKSVELSPRVENHYQLGKCRMKLSELSEAGSEFKEAQRISKRFRTTVCLKEAEALVAVGRRIDALRLIGRASDKVVSQHDKAALELFSAELNIMAFPEVMGALDRTLRLLYKSFSGNIYRRFIRVAKLFTEHLSQYYTTTGLPHSQAEVFLKWTKFLEDRKEISPEKHAELIKMKEYAARALHQGGRRLSISRGPNNARRRSSVRIGSGLQRPPSEAPKLGDLAPSPDNTESLSNESKSASSEHSLEDVSPSHSAHRQRNSAALPLLAPRNPTSGDRHPAPLLAPRHPTSLFAPRHAAVPLLEVPGQGHSGGPRNGVHRKSVATAQPSKLPELEQRQRRVRKSVV